MRSETVKRIRRRRGSRGAAMVEGAFMALIFCLFWNLTVYCAGMYLAKLESVYVVRYATLSFASHNCSTQPAAYQTPIFNPATGVGKGDQQKTEKEDCKDSNGANGAPGCVSVVPAGWGAGGFFGRGQTETSFTWSWQRPPWWQTALSGTGTVRSDAFVMCNEGPYGINVFSFLANFIGQIIGTIF